VQGVIRKQGIKMIVIFGIKEKLDPIKAQLSDVIHSCMQSVLGMPEDKRAHRFIPMEKEDFYYPGGRSDAYTVIEINMMAGRQVETQKNLIKSLFQEIESQLSIPPVDIEIIIKEQAPHQWGFRGMTGDEANDLKYKVNV
jgi:phenylpyruvate tautomerase PptA (4-oxalocrotonate tautomerase family)